MHCWKTINIKTEYGSAWLTIVTIAIFIITYSFSFVLFGRIHPSFYRDDLFWIFILGFLALYPLHKLTHYYSLLDYRKSVKLRIRRDYVFVPIIQLRIKKEIPKKRYIFTLLAPFIFINGLLLVLIILLPQFTHFSCLLFAYHCSICLIDILYVKNLLAAPKDAVIEETPKGYEILVPTNA